MKYENGLETIISQYLLHGDYRDATILRLLHYIQSIRWWSIKILCIHHRHNIVSKNGHKFCERTCEKNLQIDTHDTHTMVWLMHSIIFRRRKKIYEKNKSLSNPTLVKYRHIVCCFTTDIALIELQSNAKRKQEKRIFCQFFCCCCYFHLILTFTTVLMSPQ